MEKSPLRFCYAGIIGALCALALSVMGLKSDIPFAFMSSLMCIPANVFFISIFIKSIRRIKAYQTNTSS